MLDRLLNVLYWAACAIAVLLIVIGAVAGSIAPRNGDVAFWFFAISGAVVWGVAAVARIAANYILYGRAPSQDIDH